MDYPFKLTGIAGLTIRRTQRGPGLEVCIPRSYLTIVSRTLGQGRECSSRTQRDFQVWSVTTQSRFQLPPSEGETPKEIRGTALTYRHSTVRSHMARPRLAGGAGRKSLRLYYTDNTLANWKADRAFKRPTCHRPATQIPVHLTIRGTILKPKPRKSTYHHL